MHCQISIQYIAVWSRENSLFGGQAFLVDETVPLAQELVQSKINIIVDAQIV